MDTVTYQEDGATPHRSNASLEYLHHYFSGQSHLLSYGPSSACTISRPIHFIFCEDIHFIFCEDT